jgi:hypothetical protein
VDAGTKYAQNKLFFRRKMFAFKPSIIKKFWVFDGTKPMNVLIFCLRSAASKLNGAETDERYGRKPKMLSILVSMVLLICKKVPETIRNRGCR